MQDAQTDSAASSDPSAKCLHCRLMYVWTVMALWATAYMALLVSVVMLVLWAIGEFDEPPRL